MTYSGATGHYETSLYQEGGDCIAVVKIEDGENLEKAIKRFKRMVEKEGIIREWKKREYFEKPSTIKNRKKKSMERKIQKKIRKAQASRSY
ncbi:small subunit ribosomal protein S21 [Alkalispirochaeta americana]|uniref:Small ribosomal subunit protein bS21 n=1 Tax=Alkalispirochaeta americana TaxID=159291 RepID=A0A1N6V1K4_9SPIO|nr:small subunit ribosomal protein S21 [Alkalispirochaeta americana]